MPERLTFTADADFDALNAATSFLRSAGFSVGSTQRGAPIGVLFGAYGIQKWRNMDDEEIAALHGVITTRDGSFRHGPIFVELTEAAPSEAREAFDRAKRQLIEFQYLQPEDSAS